MTGHENENWRVVDCIIIYKNHFEHTHARAALAHDARMQTHRIQKRYMVSCHRYGMEASVQNIMTCWKLFFCCDDV